MQRQTRPLTNVLDSVPLLARRLRANAQPAAPSEDAAVARVQTDLSLALRCVDLVLALDDALKTEEPKAPSALAEMPLAVLDLGRLLAQGLLQGGVRSGQLTRAGVFSLSYNLIQSAGSGYTLSVWSGVERNDLAIVTTQPKFGGDRYWFLCPTHDQGGDRRALHLYLDPQSGKFSCRACSRLASRFPVNRLREQRSLDLLHRAAS